MRKLRRNKSHEFREGFSLGRWLSAPLRPIFRLFAGSEERLGEQGPLHRRIIHGLFAIIWFPFFLVFQLLKFVVLSWTTTRSGKAFLWGIPVLGIVALTIATIFVSRYVESGYILFNHRVKFVDGQKNGDFEKSLVCAKRICNIRDEARWKLQLAHALMGAGKKEQALTILHQLAPEDSANYADAHIRLWQYYMADPTLELTEDERLSKAGKHMAHAVELMPDRYELELELASIMHRQGKTDEAMQVYQKYHSVAPRVVPMLAKYLIDRGEAQMAQVVIEQAVNNLRKQGVDNPGDPRIWQTMYDVLMINEDYNAATRELEAARKLSDDPRFQLNIRKLQSDLLIQFAKSFEAIDTQDSYRRQLIALSQAVQMHPGNLEALDSMADLVLYPQSADFETWLVNEARENIDPSITHVIHGIRDCVRGNPISGKSHFTLAFDGDPRTSVIINNIAWMLSQVKQKHEDGLKLVDVAIDTWPAAAILYQTRGEILIELGRNDDALRELEYAAETLSASDRLHEVMAKCLDNLNRPDEAAQHRKTAEELRQKAFEEATAAMQKRS